jgi:hypothetical protein
MKFFCFEPSGASIRGRKIHQSPKKADFKVDVDIHTCIHGYLAKDKRQPASLIIFKVQLVCTREGTFDRFYMDVTFNNIANKNVSTDLAQPEVVSTAPFWYEMPQNLLSRIWKKEELHAINKTYGIEIGAGRTIPNVEARAKVKRTKMDYSKLHTDGEYHYYDKGSSSTTVDETGRRTGVWWNAKKSSAPGLKDDAGLQPNYLFAILLTRSSATAPFEARMHLAIDAWQKDKKVKSSQLFSEDIAVKRPKAIQRLSSRWIKPAEDAEGDAAPITFDPKVMLEGQCDKIDINRLARYKDGQELAKLTIIDVKS